MYLSCFYNEFHRVTLTIAFCTCFAWRNTGQKNSSVVIYISGYRYIYSLTIKPLEYRAAGSVAQLAKARSHKATISSKCLMCEFESRSVRQGNSYILVGVLIFPPIKVLRSLRIQIRLGPKLAFWLKGSLRAHPNSTYG